MWEIALFSVGGGSRVLGEFVFYFLQCRCAASGWSVDYFAAIRMGRDGEW